MRQAVMLNIAVQYERLAEYAGRVEAAEGKPDKP
jgi:hypothetical protein